MNYEKHANEFRDMAQTLVRKLAPTNKFRRDIEAKIARFDQEKTAWKSEHAPAQTSLIPEPSTKPIIRRPYVQGSETSLRAADSVSPDMARTQKRRILAAVQAAAKGLTDEEITLHTSIGPSTVRPRRGELVTEGAVYDTGMTRMSSTTDRRMTIWKARL